MNYDIKPCQADLYSGLDKNQMYFAMTYGFSKDELTYRDFRVKIQKRHTDYPRNSIVRACCREEIWEKIEGVISVSRD
jgi:hypothetical protein